MLSEKAKSRAQQKLFGIVRSYQKGELENPSPEVEKIASTVSKSDVKKMASTKHEGLPEKKKVEEAAFLASLGKMAMSKGKGMVKQKAKQVVKQKAANVAQGAIPQPNRDQVEEGAGRAAIGAGLGAVVGGPVGAAIGGSIGAVMGKKKKKVTVGGKKVNKKATNFFKAEPKITSSEGVVAFVKKGLERDKQAKVEKKIKNRKAVPYAALGASYQPEGEIVEGSAYGLWKGDGKVKIPGKVVSKVRQSKKVDIPKGSKVKEEVEVFDEAAPLAAVPAAAAKGVAVAGKVAVKGAAMAGKALAKGAQVAGKAASSAAKAAKPIVKSGLKAAGSAAKSVGKAGVEGLKSGAKTAGQTVAAAAGDAGASVIKSAGEGAAQRVKQRMAGSAIAASYEPELSIVDKMVMKYSPLSEGEVVENRMAAYTAGAGEGSPASRPKVSKKLADKVSRSSDEHEFSNRKKKEGIRLSPTKKYGSGPDKDKVVKRANTTGRGTPVRYRKSYEDPDMGRYQKKVTQGTGSLKDLKDDLSIVDKMLAMYLPEKKKPSVHDDYYDPMEDPTFDPHEAEATRGQSGRGTKGKMNVRKKYPVKEAKVDDVKYGKGKGWDQPEGKSMTSYKARHSYLKKNPPNVRSDRNERHSAQDVVFHGHDKVERDRKKKHHASKGVKKVRGAKTPSGGVEALKKRYRDSGAMEQIEVLRNLVTERAAKSGGDVALASGNLVGKTIGTVTGGLVGGLAGGFPGAAVGAVSGNVVGGKLAPGNPEKKTIVKVKKEEVSVEEEVGITSAAAMEKAREEAKLQAREDAKVAEKKKKKVNEAKGYQPEIEHIKGSDLLKNKKKVDLPPHLRLDVMKKAFAHTNKVSEGKVATGPRLGEPRRKGATHPNAGEGEKIQKRTLKWMREKGIPGSPGLQAMKDREAEHRARNKSRVSEAYRVLARDKGDKGRPAQFSYKDEDLANKFADSIRSKGGKATVAKEGVGDNVMKIVNKYRKKQKAEKKPSMDSTTSKLHTLRKEKFKTDKQKEHEKYVNFLDADD